MLNSFQHPFFLMDQRQTAPWMLKQVQHDDALSVYPPPGRYRNQQGLAPLSLRTMSR